MSDLFEIIDETEFLKNSPPEVDYNSLPTRVTGGEYKNAASAHVTVESGDTHVGVVPDPTVTTIPCNYCGHCETPNDCAWAHECPKCGAPAGKIGFNTSCKTPTGGISGLHAERWTA